MTYKIELSKNVIKFLDKMNDKFVFRFEQKTTLLSIDPFQSSIDVKPLKWKKWHFRLRIGKDRFLYEVIDE